MITSSDHSSHTSSSHIISFNEESLRTLYQPIFSTLLMIVFNDITSATSTNKKLHGRYLTAHYSFYAKEMRIIGYNQLLESYSSLTLSKMAKAFGVTVDFIDMELSRWVCCKFGMM